jgi:hypothetical protein
MRFVSTRFHGVMDYVFGILLIVAPWLLGFARGGTETWVPVILGIAVILYSLFTDYELGVSRSIPMPTHLVLDGLVGLILLVSPWLFGFSDYVRAPHVILGILFIAAALFTRKVPSYGRIGGTGGRHGMPGPTAG